MEKLSKASFPSPLPLRTDESKYMIIMERILGCSLKSILIGMSQRNENSIVVFSTARVIGELVGKLHNLKIIHGDLTTSNILAQENNTEKLVLIDFGLSYHSESAEDRAVDLYVLERAIVSTHPELGSSFFNRILEGYRAVLESNKIIQVLDRLAEVQKRGRKRDMSG